MIYNQNLDDIYSKKTKGIFRLFSFILAAILWASLQGCIQTTSYYVRNKTQDSVQLKLEMTERISHSYSQDKPPRLNWTPKVLWIRKNTWYTIKDYDSCTWITEDSLLFTLPPKSTAFLGSTQQGSVLQFGRFEEVSIHFQDSEKRLPLDRQGYPWKTKTYGFPFRVKASCHFDVQENFPDAK